MLERGVFAKRYTAIRGEYKTGRSFDHYDVLGTSSILYVYRLSHFGDALYDF